ncbi:MAG: hypothetical protein ACRDWD_02675 [Acidimicrobiia bacterium]
MSSSESSSAGTGAEIEINATFLILAFLLFFFKPTFVIDGQAYTSQPWRTPVRFPVSPGPHSVRVFFPYLFIKECGPADVDVDVPPASTVPIEYKAPWLVFLAGRVSVGAPRAAGAAA